MGFCLLQGLMFGYASDETEECMPLTCVLAHALTQKMAEIRHGGDRRLRPDCKSQVWLYDACSSECCSTIMSYRCTFKYF